MGFDMNWRIVVTENKMHVIPDDLEHTAGLRPGDLLPCDFPTHQIADTWLNKIRRAAVGEYHIRQNLAMHGAGLKLDY
jgi:hypothetical protein